MDIDAKREKKIKEPIHESFVSKYESRSKNVLIFYMKIEPIHAYYLRRKLFRFESFIFESFIFLNKRYFLKITLHREIARRILIAANC
jgi:hypothetical protein